MSENVCLRLDDQSDALQELKRSAHWVGYRREERDGRITKIPYSPWNGRHAQSNVPASWSDYQTAKTAVQTYHFDGLGYMFYQDFTGVDLDHCVSATGEIDSWARKIIKHLDSYAEFSPSGTGVHILVRGHVPKGTRRFVPPQWLPQHEKAAVEMYCFRRYFTVTGAHVPGTPQAIHAHQDRLNKLYDKITKITTATSTPQAAKKQTAKKRLLTPIQLPQSASSLKHIPSPAQQHLSDEVLLQRACGASNGERFRRLYYQGQGNDYHSPSEADMALCMHLAFWTGRNAEQIDRLFRQSALFREKWECKRGASTYGWETIQRAIQRCPEAYAPQQSKDELLKRIETLQETINDYDMIEGTSRIELQHANEAQTWSCQPHRINLHEVLACLDENELGDAQLFCEIFHQQVCYDYIDKCWYLWHEHHWQQDLAGKAILFIDALSSIYQQAAHKLTHRRSKMLTQIDQFKREQQLADLASLEHETNKLTDQIEQLNKRTISLRGFKRMSNVITLAEALMSVHTTIWDKRPFLLPTPTGVINLEDGSFAPGQPDDYMRICCPTRWTGIDAPCPRWESFMLEIFADKPAPAEVVSYLQRAFGYSITGSIRDHVLHILNGHDGRNGKDMMLSGLHGTLGDIANVVPNDIFLDNTYTRGNGSATPHLCVLHGMRMAWGSEPNMGDRINVGQIKQLTGGGDITVRPLYGKSFYTFTPTHKLFIAGNHKLTLNASEVAAWERIVMVEYGMRFVDNPDPNNPNERLRDAHLAEALQKEYSGILAWLVRGCLAWQQQGLNIPECIKADTQRYREEEDTLKRFIGDCCICLPDARVSASALYRAYRQWHLENHQGCCMTSQMFGREMTKRFKKAHANVGNFYQGIEIRLGNPPTAQVWPTGAEGTGSNETKSEGGEGLKALQTSFEQKKLEKDSEKNVETPSDPSPPSLDPPESRAASSIPDNCDPAPGVDVPQAPLSIEDQLPAFLIPTYYANNDLTLQNEETYALENLPKLKKYIRCDNCRTQWEDLIKHGDLTCVHQGVWWCDHCSRRYALMQLAHRHNYPALSLRHFDIPAGRLAWLVFARTEHDKRITYITDVLRKS